MIIHRTIEVPTNKGRERATVTRPLGVKKPVLPTYPTARSLKDIEEKRRERLKELRKELFGEEN